MTLWTFTIRQWKSRPGRAILTLASVVIGVAAVLSVATVTTSTRRAYMNLDQSIAGRATLEISTQGAGGFDERYAILLKRVPGIETLEPLLERSTILYFKGKRLKLLALGIDPQQGEAGRDYKIEEGRFELGENNGLISAEYARGLGIHVGDEVRILTRRGIKRIA
ncbi:MAG: ABC transporter permease, partial [Thermoguttaceae bacterium]